MIDKISFFQQIFKDFSPSEKDIKEFTVFFQSKSYKDKKHVIEIGECNNLIGFVYQGILKTYTIDYNGNEAITRFIEPGKFIKGNMANNVPSTSNIQCLNDCILFTANWDNVLQFSFSHKSFLDYFNSQMAEGYSKTVLILSNFIRMNAGERYLFFLDQYPGLIDKIPHYMIANHLGISAVQLSRIRKELSNDTFHSC